MGLRNAVVWLGLAEHDDEVVSYGEPPDGSYADEMTGPGMPGPAVGDGYQIAAVRPQTFRDALTIGQQFRQDTPVIVNLEDLATADAKRLVDFMSGLVFGREGDIERLSSRVFLIVPPHYRIVVPPPAHADREFFNQT